MRYEERQILRRAAGLGLLAAAFAVAFPGWAQVKITSTEIEVAGRKAVTTPSCAIGRVPKRTGSGWTCGFDETGGAGDNTGLCALYSLTGQVPDAGLGCPAQVKKYIFATSTFSEGNLGGNTGVAGADLICSQRATAGSLPGTYKAWIADSSPASDPDSRFTKAGPLHWYIRTDGQIVAIGWDDLTDGTIDIGIGFDESGVALPTNPSVFSVWTNVNRDGTQRSAADGHCTSWTDNVFTRVAYTSECTASGNPSDEPTQVGYTGSSGVTTTTFGWTEGGFRCCDADQGYPNPDQDSQKARLFCVQQ